MKIHYNNPGCVDIDDILDESISEIIFDAPEDIRFFTLDDEDIETMGEGCLGEDYED